MNDLQLLYIQFFLYKHIYKDMLNFLLIKDYDLKPTFHFHLNKDDFHRL